jgi:hypothetical protein
VVLQSIAIAGRDSKLVTWTEEEALSSFGVKCPFFFVGITESDFYRTRLSRTYSKYLRTRASRLGVLDAMRRQNQVAHDVTNILIIFV